jgi:hypothetical protein
MHNISALNAVMLNISALNAVMLNSALNAVMLIAQHYAALETGTKLPS